jgi:hypothetical protein
VHDFRAATRQVALELRARGQAQAHERVVPAERGAPSGMPCWMVHHRHEPRRRQDRADQRQAGQADLVGAVEGVEPPDPAQRECLLIEVPE